jgi:hypothetical protein
MSKWYSYDKNKLSGSKEQQPLAVQRKATASLYLLHSNKKEPYVLPNLKNVMLACVLLYALGITTLKWIGEGSTMAWDNHKICTQTCE